MEFTFNTVATILCEDGISSHRLGALIKERWGQKRILLVTDTGLVGAGLIDPVVECLTRSSHHVEIFDGVTADPPEAVVLAATKQAVREKCDFVLGFGGGSSLDVAKVVSVLAMGNQEITDIYGVDLVKGDRLPLVLVPTTAGTGSEVTSISIITTGKTSKNSVISRQLYADIAILDATLTLNLPPHVAAATGVDAMVHAIEAYTSKIKKNPLSDSLALKALSLMSHNIVAACETGENLEARRAMLLGAMLAGQAFANAPVGGIHALAYPLGGIFHIPHGHSNALVMPHMMKFNQSVCKQHYAQIAEACFPTIEGTDENKCEALLQYLELLPKMLGLETKLSAMGIVYEDLDVLATDAVTYTRLLVNNPREITVEDARAIYGAAF